MLTLSEIKEWLRIDFNEDDNTLTSLIETSCATIEVATGVTKEYIELSKNDTLKNLYKMTQIILITDLYNNENGENRILGSYYLQLEAQYKKNAN